jgi:hypothetical protein
MDKQLPLKVQTPEDFRTVVHQRSSKRKTCRNKLAHKVDGTAHLGDSVHHSTGYNARSD